MYRCSKIYFGRQTAQTHVTFSYASEGREALKKEVETEEALAKIQIRKAI